jgi:multiple sugar transport system substrate-binding protein
VNHRFNLIVVCLLIASVLLSACASSVPAPAVAPAAEPTKAPEPTAAPAPTEAPAPTAAPAPTEAPAPTTAPAASAAEPVTLTWFEHLSTEWGDEWFNKVTADFEKETGIKVQRISAPWGDLWPKMTTWSQSGEMPDVFGTWAGWTATLSQWKALADLEPLIPQLKDPEGFAKRQGSMWPDIGKFQGKLVMAPWWLQSYGLFYNKEYFEKNNLTVPTTWAELRTVLEQIKAKGEPGMEMTWGLPAEAGIHFGYLQWMWRMLGAGGDLTDGAGNPTFNTPEGKLAMQYWYDLYKDGLLLPGSEAASVQQNRGDFCAGKTPMIIDGPWMGATCKTMGSTFTVEMAPGLCGEKTCGNVVYPWYFAIAATSKHPKEALMFIDYLTSDAVGADFSKTFSIALANPVRYDDPTFASDPITGKMQKLLATKGNSPLPATLYAEEIQTMIGEEWQKVLFGKQTVDEAITSIETKWKSTIAK